MSQNWTDYAFQNNKVATNIINHQVNLLTIFLTMKHTLFLFWFLVKTFAITHTPIAAASHLMQSVVMAVATGSSTKTPPMKFFIYLPAVVCLGELAKVNNFSTLSGALSAPPHPLFCHWMPCIPTTKPSHADFLYLDFFWSSFFPPYLQQAATNPRQA